MKSVVVVGTAGKDEHIRIKTVKDLPPIFNQYLKKTLPFSGIEKYYGSGWDMIKVYTELKNKLVTPIRYSYGGRAPHVAYGLALLKGKVSLITTFGSDYDHPYPGFFGGGYVSHLKNAGVSIDLCEVETSIRYNILKDIGAIDRPVWVVKNRLTSTIVCVKDEVGNDFYYIDDLMGAGTVESWRPVPEKVIRESDIVFVTSSETKFMDEIVKTAFDLKKVIVIDVGSYGITPEYIRSVIPKTDILLGNEYELNQVVQAFNIEGPSEILDITDDKPMAVLLENKILGTITVFQRNKANSMIGPVAINKTGSSVGACDGMATGILSGLQRGAELSAACKIGLIEASSIWEVEGVQEGMLNQEELWARYAKNFGSDEFSEIKRGYQ